jgi:hypothetical protein
VIQTFMRMSPQSKSGLLALIGWFHGSLPDGSGRQPGDQRDRGERDTGDTDQT